MFDRSTGHGLLALVILLSQLPSAWCTEAPVVDTKKTATGTSVTNEQIQNLPTGGRSYADIVQLQPGIANNKANPSDSVNWRNLPLTDSQAKLASDINAIPADQLQRVEVPRGGASAAYGSDAITGVINFINKTPDSVDFLVGRQLLQLPLQREWPGEAMGANGSLIATGKAGGKQVAVLYDPDGYPIDYYTKREIEEYGDEVLDDLHEMCYMINSGKVSVERGRLSNGKISTSSGKLHLDQYGDIMEGPPSSSSLSVSGNSGVYNLPAQYRLDTSFKYKDGGMQRIDPQPHPDSKPRSQLQRTQRWLQAFAGWLIQEAVAAPAAARPQITRASTTDADGNTLSLEKQPDGTTTRTVTDSQGNVVDQSTVAPEPVTKVPPREKGTSASTKDADGNTVTIKKQPDGTTTRTVTAPDGHVVESGPVTQPEPTKVPPRKPGTTTASTTDENGQTTTINRNPDGSVTRMVTDASGKVLEQGPLNPPPATKPNPRDPATPFASTKDANGNIITLQKQPDGTVTQTVTGPSGNVISQGTLTPPPVTKPQPHKPATSASTTDADGNTLSVEKQADGSIARTLTAPDGTVLERTVNGKPAMPATPTHKAAADSAQTVTAVTTQPSTQSTQPAVKETTTQVQSSQPSGYSDYAMGLEYKPSWNVTPSLHYSFNAPKSDTPNTNQPVLEEPFTSYYAESGVIIGDTVYSNLGVYKVGEHPILNKKKNESAAANDKTWLVEGGLHKNWGLDNTLDYGSSYGLSGGAYKALPRDWTPQYVGVLPYGCGHEEKLAVFDDMRSAVSGTLPSPGHAYLWEPVYVRVKEGKKKDNEEAAGIPNDPLYAHGSTAQAAAMKLPPKPKQISHGPDMSMAAPPEAGPSPMAEFGPSHGGQKGPQALDQWGLFATGFTPQGQGKSAWDLVDTSKPNTLVAIIDSGLDLAHPDGPQYVWANPREIAGNNIDDDKDGYVDDVHGWNFNDEDSDLTDYAGHGTLVAGVIAAKRNNNIGIAGINPGAQIMVLKVTNRFGQTNSLAIYRAIHYAVKHGARVINISLGGAGVSKLEQLAINFAHAHGALVVIAAGNEASDAAKSGPAAARRAITVAGLDMDRSHTKLSNEGTVIAIAAPGQNIYSLQSKDAEWPGPAFERDRQYRTATGTSFSAPMVAATASLILAKQPNLPNFVVEDMLLNSTHPLGEAAWNGSTGWGLLNAADALSMDPAQIITLWPNEVVVDKKVGSARIYGTIRGVFSSYHLDLGKGKQPREWQAAGSSLTRPVTQGLLGEVSLKGIKEGVVRITAESANGTTKVAYVPVSLK